MSDKFEMYRQLLSGGSTSDMSLFCNGHDDIIIIGGTREQTFNLPFSFKLIDKLIVVYVQDGNIILKKTEKDFTVADFDDSLIYLTLNETDTMKFKEGLIKIQMKVLLKNYEVGSKDTDKSILISNILYNNGVNTIDHNIMINSDAPLYALQANINSDEINLIDYFKLQCGSESVYKIKFIFDSSWDNYAKIAIFKDEYNHQINEPLADGDECIIPYIILQDPGNINVGIVGYYKLMKKLTTWSNSIRVITSPLYDNTITSKGYSGGGSSVPEASEDTPGIMKLYQRMGYNTDGTISQSIITRGFESIKFGIDEDDEECLVLNVGILDS